MLVRVASGLALLALAALVPAPASAAQVLLVSDAGGDLGIASVLEADGHAVEIRSNDFATGNASMCVDLARFDLVVWSANGSGYGDVHGDPVVFSCLRAFVETGGRVFVTGYDSVASPTDPLLIEFLGATGSTDVPGPPGPVTQVETSLTSGLIDLRGVTPIPASSDRDTLTGLGGDTIEIVGTSGGGGAQWTLRRLGRGEIVYVSNGDAGATSTSGWTDGSSAYQAALRNFAFASAGAAHAEIANRGSPRRARVMYLLAASTPAVLLAPDRAWMPASTETPLSICAGPTCHPIRELRACSAPECPGDGTLMISSERLADVADYPRDYTGWNRERTLLTFDPELASLTWALAPFPGPGPTPPRPVEFIHSPREWLGWELHFSGGITGVTSNGVVAPSISGSFGLRFQPAIEELLDVMYGTMMGIDARVTVLPGVSGQRPDDYAVLVGLSPAFGYAFPHEAVRIPPLFAWVFPELGVAVSSVRPATWYAAWHLDGAVLVDEHVGLDARADLVVVDEWVDGDDVELILTLGVGVFFR